MTRPVLPLALAALLLATWLLAGAGALPAAADGAADPYVTVARRDREDPSVGATLVFDLALGRLLRSSGSGHTILFDDRNIPVRITPATIEWEVAHNTYTLNRATLELDAVGRVYVCQLAKRQL